MQFVVRLLFFHARAKSIEIWFELSDHKLFLKYTPKQSATWTSEAFRRSLSMLGPQSLCIGEIIYGKYRVPSPINKSTLTIYKRPLVTVWQSLTHWGRDKMADILQTTFSNAFSCLKMYEFGLRFHWNLFLRFKLTISQQWFWLWLGAE